MRSLNNLRQKMGQFSEVFCTKICRRISNSPVAPRTGLYSTEVLKRKANDPISFKCLTWHGSVLRPVVYPLYFDNNAALELPSSHPPIVPNAGEIIGYKPTDEIIIGYMPTEKSEKHCSKLVKIRRKKMNKHKYKKRRKRDKFKRRNLENLRERKKRAKEKAQERAKSDNT